MKRFLCAVLATAMLICPVFAAEANDNDDFQFEFEVETINEIIGPSSWARPEVEAANEAGLVTPHTSSNFKADITRFQFAELVVNLIEKVTGESIVPAPSGTFSDTDDVVIRKAYATEVVKGVGDGTFAPEDYTDRQQIAAMICRAIRYLQDKTGKTWLTKPSSINEFPDGYHVDTWFREEVGAMAANGIMRGDGTNLLPDNTCTIQESILLVYRFYQKTL